jgi:hypothetical protein
LSKIKKWFGIFDDSTENALVRFAVCVLLMVAVIAQAAPAPRSGLGVDVDFYTGSIAKDSWLRMKKAGVKFVIAQAWGGRSRNEFASSQLTAARTIGKMKQAAYVLLNYDDRVCPTYANPVRDSSGRCTGDLVTQAVPGSRWQVQQGLAALGKEVANVAFIAIDVEWFLRAGPPASEEAQARRRQAILDAIDEVRMAKKKAVIYTRNAQGHWRHITGCEFASTHADCKTLHDTVNDPRTPVPLWDVQTGTPDLANFRPYGAWTQRAGRQYKLDKNMFGLPKSRTVDLNVFDLSLFSQD